MDYVFITLTALLIAGVSYLIGFNRGVNLVTASIESFLSKRDLGRFLKHIIKRG